MPTATQSIRQIVTVEPLSAAVFERFEINLCTQANVELERVCAEMQLSVEQVLEKLADTEAQAHGVTILNVESYSLTRLIRELRKLTNGFESLEWASPRNIGLHASLAAFANDLHQHVYLENDLLIQRAIALEIELRERS